MDSFSGTSGLGFQPASSPTPPPPPSFSLDLEAYSHGYNNIYNRSHQVEETSERNGPFAVGSVPEMEDPVPAGNGAAGPDKSKVIGEGKSKGKTMTKKVRKPRYAFQTRSQVDILDDGYRWRKYGQKAVKNNNFPRSYYRCTYHGCNVRKQVQRLNKDEGVVVTTYEGVHSHPIERPNDNFEHILNQMHVISNSLIPMKPHADATN